MVGDGLESEGGVVGWDKDVFLESALDSSLRQEEGGSGVVTEVHSFSLLAHARYSTLHPLLSKLDRGLLCGLIQGRPFLIRHK